MCAYSAVHIRCALTICTVAHVLFFRLRLVSDFRKWDEAQQGWDQVTGLRIFHLFILKSSGCCPTSSDEADWIQTHTVTQYPPAFILLLLSVVKSSINPSVLLYRQPDPAQPQIHHNISQMTLNFRSWAVSFFPPHFYLFIILLEVKICVISPQNFLSGFVNYNLVFLFLMFTSASHLVVNHLRLWS